MERTACTFLLDVRRTSFDNIKLLNSELQWRPKNTGSFISILSNYAGNTVLRNGAYCLVTEELATFPSKILSNFSIAGTLTSKDYYGTVVESLRELYSSKT